MDEFIKISDVSKALDISASTLRYWEKEGLIRFERDKKNNYRHFSFLTMADICNIMLFRNLELPVDTLKEISTKNADEMGTLLGETKVSLKQRIEYFQQVIDRIQAKEQLFEEYRHLQSQPLHVVQTKLPPVYSFDFGNKEMVQFYLDDPSLAVDILSPTCGDSYAYGIFMKSGHQNILRKGDSEKRNYLYGLLWMNMDRKTNVEEFRSTAKNLGYSAGETVCQYLVSTKEVNQGYCHFFKAWLEVVMDGS